MKPIQLVCPKCRGEMERGYAIDTNMSFEFSSQWAPGVPKKAGAWFAPAIKTPKPVVVLTIGVFRCRSCGFLESYAREEFDPT